MMGVVFIAMLAVAPSAYAYVDEVPAATLLELPALQGYFADPENPQVSELPDPIPCVVCHGTTAANQPSGPHGNYDATSNKCATCHSVHRADAGGIVLLPAATVLETCETCHDGTSGSGVYGVLTARGVETTASHSMLDLTRSIPGGDAETGGSRDSVEFSGASSGLTCTDCHSPHGSNLVDPFTGDRARSTTDSPDPADPVYTSTRLLRREPVGTDSTVGPAQKYGSDWCATCHAGRLSWHDLYNHNVESEQTYTGTGEAFHYDNVARITGVGSSTTELGTLGRNNFGYVMPDPRTPEQTGHEPICQQCHEDARAVGNTTLRTVTDDEVFDIDQTDGLDDNPRFQVFPHESDTPAFLIEEDNALCMNCHKQPSG